MYELAREWLRQDSEEETRSEIETLLVQKDLPALELCLSPRISFGTAGLRARMGAGYNRINSLTIIQTSQGLAEYLLATQSNTQSAGVIIGRDGRHNSEKFANLTAAAFIAKGIKVLWFNDTVHTPLIPFAVKTLGAAAGVMITASHNPASDNGYKVYASNGAQILSPADKEIADSISRNLEPLTWTFPAASPLIQDVSESMKIAYSAVVGKHLKPEVNQKFPDFVYTPMHGVGLPYFTSMVKNLRAETQGMQSPHERGGGEMFVVNEQAEPDPDFPTVKYPNPEESGALDLAKKHADQNQVSLIIANDPDADRFAAAEKVHGQWQQFTGDQMGILLAYYVFSEVGDIVNENDVMLSSAVSSSMLGKLASREGFHWEETLTGFKWLGNRALDLTSQGKRVHFAYEEALGYMFPSVVADKDGIIAAGVFLNACAKWGSPWLKLHDLYHQYGCFVTMNTYWRSPDTAATLQIFDRIRADRDKCQHDLVSFNVGGKRINRFRDLSTGIDDGLFNGKATLPSSPDNQMVTCWIAGSDGDENVGMRFTLRTSGTEPKIKLYLESWGSTIEAARRDATDLLKALKSDWLASDLLQIEEKYASL